MGENLRGRVGERARQNGNGDGSGGEVAVREQPLPARVERMLPEFQKAMPRGMEAQMLVRDAQTVFRKTPKLLQCTPDSVLGGLMNIAQLGLRVGVLGHAWLLPMWNNKERQHEAQLIIGYQGLVELGHRSGRIDSLIARAVYERDEFDIEYGLSDNLIHKPYRGPEGRGETTDYYAIVKFQGGGHAFWHMTKAEVEQHRDRFAMARKNGTVVGPWRDDFDSMALKTQIRALAKYIPKATEFANAIAVDESVRLDWRPDSDPAHTSLQIEAGNRADYEGVSEDDGAVGLDDPPIETEAADWPDVATPGTETLQ